MLDNKKPGALLQQRKPGLGNTSRVHFSRLGHVPLAEALKRCVVSAATHGEITHQTAERLIQALGLEGA